MGCCKNLICGHGFHRFAISFIICLISLSSLSHSRLLNAHQGRKLPQTADLSKVRIGLTTSEEEKAMIFRAQIGSRPPRCQRRCTSCAHCDAIQVPTNPQTRNGIKNAAASVLAAAYYGRGEDTSNYKPMSWKCKCGNLIFNP